MHARADLVYLCARPLGRASAVAFLFAAGLAAAQSPLLPPPKEPLQRAAPRPAPDPQQVVPGASTRLQTRPAADGGAAFGQLSRRAADLLARSEHAAASWQACLYDALRQGIPMSVAITLCEIKLWQDDKRGWGDAGIASAVFREPPPPPNVVGACASGADPNLGKGNPYAAVSNETLRALFDSMLAAEKQIKDPATLHALNAQLAKIAKELEHREKTGKSVKDSGKLELTIGEIEIVDEPAKKEAPKGTAKKEAPKGTIEVGEIEFVDDIDKPATKKPSTKPPKRTGGDAHRTSPEADCAQALAQAQEFLRECQRTGWKTGACQVFAARAKGCPDPRLAYVDPGAGYACGESADPKLVAEAYAKRCEQLVRPGPDGSNPCRPKTPEFDVRAIKGLKDLCNDPKAYHTGEGCVVELVVPGPARLGLGPTVEEVIAIATNKFGGPIFVLPKPPPVPRGPQPMPGPGTGPQPKPQASTGLESKPGTGRSLLTPPPAGSPR